MTYEVIEGVWCGNYTRPDWAYFNTVFPCSGVVIKTPDDWSRARYMFHPYSGAPPQPCAPPAGRRTYIPRWTPR